MDARTGSGYHRVVTAVALGTALVLCGLASVAIAPATAVPPLRSCDCPPPLVTTYSLSILGGDGTSGPVTPGPATSSALGATVGLARDSAGNLYLADGVDAVVEKITPDGTISIVAGDGTSGDTEPGPATQTHLGTPNGVAVDTDGNIYIADGSNAVVSKVTPTGELSVVAGILGQRAATGSVPVPGLATATALNTPAGVAIGPDGSLYVSDWGNYTVSKVTPSGQLSVFAGSGDLNGRPAAPGPATNSPLYEPYGMAFDSQGDLILADYFNSAIERITPGGTLSVIAGRPGIIGEPTPGPAVDSLLKFTSSVAVDGADNIYVADSFNQLVEKITPDGTLTVIAGNGSDLGTTTAGDALATAVHYPSGLAVDPDGNVYVSTVAPSQVLELTRNVPTAPSVPRHVQATGPELDAAIVLFAPPDSDGHSPITGYEYSLDGGQSWQPAIVTGTAPNLSTTISGLGGRRTALLRAVNDVGPGPAATVTIVAPPAVSTTPPTTTPPTTRPKTTRDTWYRDPLTKHQRAELPAVPKQPARTTGRARSTAAIYRTRHGILAVPAARARGHQLSAHQAVQVTSLFRFNSATLSAAGRARLRILARSLIHVRDITCEGYADYAGSAGHELALSRQRAKAVCTYLAARHEGLRTHTVGYGRTHPAVIGGTTAQRAINRRVDVLATR